MKLIQSITIGAGGNSSAVFNNIPQIAGDLVMIMNVRNTQNTVTRIRLYYNSVISAYYSDGIESNSGSNAAIQEPNSGNILNGMFPGTGQAANLFNYLWGYAGNTTGTTIGKSWQSMTFNVNTNPSGGNVNTTQIASYHTTTQAVTQISVIPEGGTFAEGSIFSLYRIGYSN